MHNNFSKNIVGKNNAINLNDTVYLNNCAFNINGNDNVIQIGEMCDMKDVTFYIKGNNNKIIISNEVKFTRSGELWIEDDKCEILINRETTIEQAHIAVTEPGSSIVIGADCMFAYDIDLRTGDSHSIIDASTKKRLNYAKNIVINDHVWIGAHCSILKGVSIANNSIVATRSVVTKPITKQGVIIGGIPASIIKENINWDRKRIYENNRDGNN